MTPGLQNEIQSSRLRQSLEILRLRSSCDHPHKHLFAEWGATEIVSDQQLQSTFPDSEPHLRLARATTPYAGQDESLGSDCISSPTMSCIATPDHYASRALSRRRKINSMRLDARTQKHLLGWWRRRWPMQAVFSDPGKPRFRPTSSGIRIKVSSHPVSAFISLLVSCHSLLLSTPSQRQQVLLPMCPNS
jgi:hypothetical protein